MARKADYTVRIVDASGAPDMSVAVVGDQVVDLSGANDGDLLVVQPDGTVAPEPVVDGAIPSGTYVGPTVKAYGAIGDGVTDDTAAIQAAIDANTLVYFPTPAVAYRCNSGLTLREGSYLLGEAYGTLIDSYINPDDDIFTADDYAVRVVAGGAGLDEGVRIENLWIKGHAQDFVDRSWEGLTSFGFYGGSQINKLVLHNTIVSGFNYNIALISATHSTITNCELKDAVNGNLYLGGGCEFVHVADSGLLVVNATGHASTNALTSLQNVHLADHGGAAYPRHVSFRNVLIDEVARATQVIVPATVRIDKGDDLSFEDSLVYIPVGGGSGYGIRVGAGSSRVSINNTRVLPYEADANHIPVQTILIAATASGSILRDVTTVANGGGDILDNGTGTTLVNVNGVSNLAIQANRVLNVNTTTVGNVGAGEDNLSSYALAAGQLAANGDSVSFEAAGTISASINAKRLRVKFGAATIFDSGAAGIPISTAIEWALAGRVVRTGAATQKAYVRLNTSSASLAAYVDYATAAETLSGAMTLLVTGEGVDDNDIVQETLVVVWEPAP